MFLSSLFFGISGPKFSKIFRKLKFLGAIESQAGGFLEDVTGSCRRTLRGFCEKLCTSCSFSWEAFRFRMPCKANYSTSGMTVWARSIRGRVARTSARQVSARTTRRNDIRAIFATPRSATFNATSAREWRPKHHATRTPANHEAAEMQLV